MNAPRVTKGSASLVYFYYGDDKFITLCQETLKLKKAMEGYDRVVLLKHDTIPSILDFSEADERLADVVAAPTRANFAYHLKDLARDGYMIDLWIFAHGFRGGFLVSKGRHGDNDAYTKAKIEADLGSVATGLSRLPIRMVWSTLCYGATLNATWQKLGAKVAGGSRFINFFPNQFGRFANEWNRGTVSYRDALERADTAASRTVVHTYIATIDAPRQRSEWGRCPFGRTVLGSRPCAKTYFTKRWNMTDTEYRDDLSGKLNMNHSSEKIVAGQGALTKRSAPTWS
ncbi:MAG: hypothetical protein ACRDJE_20420 [Dehalococcoidia bacterium]